MESSKPSNDPIKGRQATLKITSNVHPFKRELYDLIFKCTNVREKPKKVAFLEKDLVITFNISEKYVSAISSLITIFYFIYIK